MYVDLSKVHSGFCDKLKKLTLYIAYSNILKIKNIEIYDKKTIENPFLFTELCKVNGFKVIRTYKKRKEYFHFIDSFNSNPNLKNIKFIEKKLSIQLGKNFLKKWIETYKLIEPKIKIKKFKKPTIGIHIRLTDKLVSLKEKLFEIPGKDVVLKKDYEQFKKDLENKIINKKYNFFLASDSIHAKKEIMKIFKKKKIKLTLNKLIFNPNKFRQTSGKGFVKDLFCLAQCKKIYSTGGGVPSTAVMISKEKIHYNKITYQKILNIKIEIINFYLYPLGKFYKKLFP